MGGGGFTVEPDNTSLDAYVLTLAPAPVPRICFLPTASGDPDEQIVRFYGAYGDRPCEPSHLSLFRLGQRPMSVREHLLAQDIVYIGGGSMRNLLAIWREHGLDVMLREAWDAGIVLAGLSAGSMCWFEGGITMSGGAAEAVRGLGFLPGSNCVHYDGEPERRPAYLEAIRGGALPSGYGVDDGVGLVFEGRRLAAVVSSRRRARAYRVALVEDVTVEAPIAPRFLGAPDAADRAVPADVAEFRALREARGQRGRG